jgi:hypothetical protein
LLAKFNETYQETFYKGNIAASSNPILAGGRWGWGIDGRVGVYVF